MKSLDDCKLRYAAGVIAVDTETTSLDSLNADLVGVSISPGHGAGCTAVS